jgi:NitT/TauT family transport system ATP-binding protein
MAATAGASDNIVEFKNVTKIFHEDTPRASTAIRDVSFTVENRPDRGEFVGILGPSGCGKSTIIRMIAGLRPHFPATVGSVKVGGKEVQGPGADRGMVFQDYTSFDNRTVLENVAFGLECSGLPFKQRKALAEEWICKVGLDVSRDSDKYPHQLSGGMRQRVAIARTLILRPKIILMDEPFGALDPVTRRRLQDEFLALQARLRKTVVLVTHDVAEAFRLADRIAVMEGGTVVQVGAPEAIRAAPASPFVAAFLDSGGPAPS